MSRKAEKSRKNIWKDEAFKERVTALITTGILLKGGMDALMSNLEKEYPEDFKRKKAAKSNLEKFIWNAERLRLLKKYVRLNVGLEDVYKQLHYIPKELIDRKAKDIRGHSVLIGEFRAPSQAGVNRLMVTEEIEKVESVKLPQGTREDPFVVSVENPNNFYFPVLEAPFIGLKYNPVFDENLARNTLIWAKRQGADCVFLTGGLLFMELKRSSGAGLMTHRARMSGYNFNPEVIAKEYRAEAKRIRENRPPNEAVFETLRERYKNLVTGYAKIVTDKYGKRIFNKPLLITLSRGEEELQDAAAEAEASYITVVTRNKLEVLRQAKLHLLAYEVAENGNDSHRAAQLRAELDDITSNLARTRVTNFSPEDRQFYAEKVRSYMIRLYEELVPGAKVIAQGTTTVKMGDKLIEIKQDRDEAVTDSLLHRYLLDEAGRRALDGTLPDAQLLASSLSLHQRWGVTERMKDKKAGSTPIFQLPVALDKHAIEIQTRDVIRKGSPVERLLRDPHFEPSVFALRYVGGDGNDMWIPENLSVRMLTKLNEHTAKGNGKVKYIYLDVSSDEHIGHRWKGAFYDVGNEKWLGLESGFMELMRRHYLKKNKLVPIHGKFGLGDSLQAHNFETQNQPHEEQKFYSAIETEFNAIRESARRAGTPAAALAKLDEIHEKALFQLRIRGEDWVQRQFDSFIEDVLEPNADYYLSILRRSRKSGVKFTGVGQVLRGKPGSRDIGVITDLGGDHFGWTIKNFLVETALYRYFFRSLIQSVAPGEFSKEELELAIRTPYYGNRPNGVGLVSAPSGYTWGVSLRHEPPDVGIKNGDRLLPTVKNVLACGDFAEIFGGKRAIHLSGGIHRFGWVHARMIDYISNAAGTFADPYSLRGWSRNNTGKLVIGLPAKGPDYGPIKLIPFNHDLIRELLLNPDKKIDFEKIFNDAL